MVEKLIKTSLIKIWEILEKHNFSVIQIPTVSPNSKTLETFELLKKIYNRSQRLDLKIWISGSWAVMGAYQNFIKDTSDIDITLKTPRDENQLSQILFSLGLKCIGPSKFGAVTFVSKNNIEIDFKSIKDEKTHFYNIRLYDDFGELNGFKFRIVPRKELIKVYNKFLLEKGRPTYPDLVKIKALNKAIKYKNERNHNPRLY